MPLARYHHLTVEAHDIDVASRFWCAALGCTPTAHTDGHVSLPGASPADAIEILAAPPRSSDFRVHLDIHAPCLDALVAAGATVVDDGTPWAVVRCPEGREVGVLRTSSLPDTTHRLYQLVLDSPEPEANAAWWARILDTSLRPVVEDPDVAFIEPVPRAPFESLVFARETGPKVVPNSVRMSVTTYDPQGLVYAGARIVGDDGGDRVRMVDPFGVDFDAIPLAR